MEKKGKKRNRALLLLLLLFFMIGVISVYYYMYPDNGHRKVVQTIPTKKTENIKFIVNDSVDMLLADTTIGIDKTGVSGDTSGLSENNVIANDTVAPIAEKPEETAPVKDNADPLRGAKGLQNISPDDDIICMWDPVKKNLYFHPSRTEWSNVYLIYPNPNNKNVTRRNLIYPDFEGIVYPVYKKGKVTYNGDTQEAVAVKINTPANRERSYVIQTGSNPSYFVFGDHKDKSRWYIYERGKVRKFTPPENFDEKITEKP